jgi:hypothetical protein
MHAAVSEFCDWLQLSPLSVAIQSVEWVVPAVQTAHILAIAALFGSSLLFALRLLGASGGDLSEQWTARRYLPVVWWSLPVLLVSGAVLIIAEPARSLLNAAFQLKLVLTVFAVGVLVVLGRPLAREADFWAGSARRRGLARSLSLLSLGLWLAVITAGRFIAYVQPS